MINLFGSGGGGGAAVNLTPILNRIAATENDITEIDTNLVTVQNKVTQTETDITELDTNLEAVQNRVTKTETDITELDTNLEAVQNRVTQTETDITELDTNLEAVQNRVTQTENDITELDTNLVTVQNEVANFSAKWKKIKTTVYLDSTDKKMIILDDATISLRKGQGVKIKTTTGLYLYGVIDSYSGGEGFTEANLFEGTAPSIEAFFVCEPDFISELVFSLADWETFGQSAVSNVLRLLSNGLPYFFKSRACIVGVEASSFSGEATPSYIQIKHSDNRRLISENTNGTIFRGLSLGTHTVAYQTIYRMSVMNTAAQQFTAGEELFLETHNVGNAGATIGAYIKIFVIYD